MFRANFLSTRMLAEVISANVSEIKWVQATLNSLRMCLVSDKRIGMDPLLLLLDGMIHTICLVEGRGCSYSLFG